MQGLTSKDKDKDKDLTHKDKDKDRTFKDKDLNLVLKESLRTRTRINITDCFFVYLGRINSSFSTAVLRHKKMM